MNYMDYSRSGVKGDLPDDSAADAMVDEGPADDDSTIAPTPGREDWATTTTDEGEAERDIPDCSSLLLTIYNCSDLYCYC